MIEVFEGAKPADLARPELRERAIEALEAGHVIHLPDLAFPLKAEEAPMVDPSNRVLLRRREPRQSGRPTLLFYPPTGRLRGGRLAGVPKRQQKAMLARFSDWAEEIAQALLPFYRPAMEREFTTFRPCPRSKRQALHMDAAIARPTQGRCMLRIFTNVNGAGLPRVWQVGEPFEDAARRFVPRLPRVARDRFPGASPLFRLLGISVGPATPYDFTMRRLRDLMTGDKEYQRSGPRAIVEFATGSTWMAFTDLALHGAVAGQHSLDQTYLISTDGMRHPERSSRRILERLTGRSLQ